MIRQNPNPTLAQISLMPVKGLAVSATGPECFCIARVSKPGSCKCMIGGSVFFRKAISEWA